MTLINKLIIFFVSLSGLVTPLGYGGAMMPDLYRAAYLEMGIIIITAIYFFHSMKNKHAFFINSSIHIPLALFLLWALISVIWSSNKFESFVLLSVWIEASLLYFIVANNFKNLNDITKLLSFIVIIAAVVAIIGIAQHLFDFNWIAQAIKPAATFGNKNMAVHFLILVMPISVSLFINSKNLKSSILFATTTGILLLYFIYADSKAGFLALLVQIVVFAYVLIKKKPKVLSKQKIIIILIPFMFVLLLMNYTNKGFKSNIANIADKFIYIVKQVNFDKETQNERIPMWLNTFNMVVDNPILGVGAGNWRIHYPKYSNSISHDYIMTESRMHKHLHNDWLEILSSLGLIGFSLLIWLITIIIKTILKILKHSKDELQFLILAISLSGIGIVIDGLFTFPFKLIIAPILIMTFVGILAGLEWQLAQTEAQKKAVQILTLNKLVLFVLGVIFSVLFMSLIMKNQNWLKAQVHYSNALIYQSKNQNLKMEAQAKKAVFYNPNQDLHNLTLGHAYLKLKKFKEAEKIFLAILKTRPYHYPSMESLINIYLLTKDGNKTFSMLERLSEYMPKHKVVKKYLPAIYNNVAAQYLKAKDKDYKKIKEIFLKILNINENDANTHKNLAVILWNFLNDRSLSVKHFKKALSIDPNIKQAAEIEKVIKAWERQKAK